LNIVLKSPDTVPSANLRQIPFAVMPEWGMAYVMAKSDSLNEILVQPQKAADIPRYLGEKLNVQNPVGDVVVVNQIKHLRLVNISGVGQGM
jgi:hypothetical protein